MFQTLRQKGGDKVMSKRGSYRKNKKCRNILTIRYEYTSEIGICHTQPKYVYWKITTSIL